MAMASRLSVLQLANVLGTAIELRLDMVFLLAQVDPGGGEPSLKSEFSLASQLVKALGCTTTLVDFASIPRSCVQERATELQFNPPEAVNATIRRAPSDAEVGRCLRAWDFALEVSCIPVDAAVAAKPHAVVASKTIKLSSFISADIDGTAQLMSSEEISSAEAVYKTRLGILPQEAAMPSEEQLSALKFILTNDMTPYVDFALWGPFNRRFIRRKTAMVSFTPDVSDGTWKPSHKLTGPGSFDAWLSNWNVFRTAMVMLEGAEPERLDQYAGFIRELHEKHTSKCWWLIYQADTRLRSERLGRIVRKASVDDAAPIDTKNRWSNAFTKAIDMEAAGIAEFWNNEVHRPAGEFKAGLASHHDLAKDGTAQWLQPQGSPNKRQRGRGGRDNVAGAQTPSWWDPPQPTNWNALTTPAQPKDGDKGKPKGIIDKSKGGPKGGGKGGRGGGGKGGRGGGKGGRGGGGKHAIPTPPPAPNTAGN
jgi:uncharacterized membrane protein YgcG